MHETNTLPRKNLPRENKPIDRVSEIAEVNEIGSLPILFLRKSTSRLPLVKYSEFLYLGVSLCFLKQRIHYRLYPIDIA